MNMGESIIMSKLENFIKTVVLKNETAKCEILITKKTEFGGFLCDIYFVNIQNKVKDKSDDEKLVLKVSWNSLPSMGDFVCKAFTHEIIFYSKVAAKINLLQNDQFQNPLTAIPDFHGSQMEENFFIVALKNVSPDGFKMLEITTILDENHVRIALNQLAKFHALSFICCKKFPEHFDECKKTLKSVYMDLLEYEMTKKYHVTLFNLLKPTLEKIGNQNLIERYLKFCSLYLSKAKKSLLHEGEYRTIIHGDMWANNLMFKYQTINSEETPNEVKFLDWQMSLFGSPIVDLSFLLYTSASKDCFDKLDELLLFYYSEFSSVIKQFGYDPDTIFPLHSIKLDWPIYAAFAYLRSFAVTQIKLSIGGPIMMEEFNKFETVEEIEDMLKSRLNLEEFNQRTLDITLNAYKCNIF